MKPIKIYLAILSMTFFAACGNDKNSAKTPTDDTAKIVSIADKPAPQVDVQLDDLARLLAGLPTNQYYKNIGDTVFYNKYKSSVNNEWSKLDKQMIQSILTWQQANINHTLKGNKTCFYPYSGADFLYANLFFPDAENYILIGLEPPGSVTDPTTLSKDELSNYLYSNDYAMAVSHDKGFYRTLAMEVDFTKKYLNGTIHNILYYTVRLGYKVTGVDYFKLDSLTGVPDYTKAVYGEKNDKYGVKIKFTDNKGSDRAIYYLSYDISDTYMANRPALFKFLDSFGGHYLYLKAASYLPQHPRFTMIQDYMLNSSSLVVQDDSGLPYRSFNNGKWDINLWGDYRSVLPVFKGYFQKDMREAYVNLPEKKILPFHIGYSVLQGVTNLQYCIKKNQ
jgi:hypothetical protein